MHAMQQQNVYTDYVFDWWLKVYTLNYHRQNHQEHSQSAKDSCVNNFSLMYCESDHKKMVLFHIAAVGWISTQTGYEIQGSISTQN